MVPKPTKRKNSFSALLKQEKALELKDAHVHFLKLARTTGLWGKMCLAGILLMAALHMISSWKQYQGIRHMSVRLVSSTPQVDPESFSGMIRHRAIDNQIVLTVTTISFVNMTLNLICSWERIKLSNYVVGALDEASFELLKSKGHSVFPAYKHSLLGGGELKSSEKRREDFHKVNFVKEEAIIWALMDGYEVVLTDTDLVWLHNPMKDLKRYYREYDFLFQAANNNDNEAFELNGGFLYVKPTKSSVTAMQLLISTLTQDWSKNDQTEFRNILCNGSNRSSNTTCADHVSGAKTLMLSRYKYAKAYLLSLATDVRKTLKDPELFTLHYNGGGPEKKQMQMEKHEVWYVDDNQDCAV